MNKSIKAAITAVFALALATTAVLAQSPASQPGTVKFEVITPGANQTMYGNKVPILFSVENFQVVDYNQNPQAKAGQGHIHIWLDDQNPTAQTAIKVTEETYTLPDVAFGDHALRAELVGNDHKSVNPPQVVTVSFKNASIPAPAADTQEPSFDKKTAFVILVVVALVIVAAWWYTKDEDDEESDMENPPAGGKPKKKKVKKSAKRAKK